MRENENLNVVSDFITKKLSEMSDLKREKSRCQRKLEQLSAEIEDVRSNLNVLEDKIKSVKYEVCESCERLNITVVKNV